MLGGGLDTKDVSWLLNCVRTHNFPSRPRVPPLKRKDTNAYGGVTRQLKCADGESRLQPQ